MHVALAGGPVAEENHGGLSVGVAHPAVQPRGHRPAGRVQALVADDDRVHVEAHLAGVPGAVVGATEDAHQLGGVDAPAPRDAVLAVGGERHVLRRESAAGADLGGLLAQQWHPDAELALPLQRAGLPVDPAHQHHVPVVALQVLQGDVGDVGVEALVVHAITLGGEQLHQLGAALAGGPQPGNDLLRVGRPHDGLRRTHRSERGGAAILIGGGARVVLRHGLLLSAGPRSRS